MVDTHVSGACRAICGGSSPPIDIYFTLFTLTDKGTFTISEPVFAKQICKALSRILNFNSQNNINTPAG